MFEFRFDMSFNSLGVSEIKIIDTNIIGKQIIDKTLYEQCLHMLDF